MRGVARRVVIRHNQGPLAGLCEIMGLWAPLEGHDIPQFIPNVLVWGQRRCWGIDLVRISDLAFHYTEVVEPAPQETPHVRDSA